MNIYNSSFLTIVDTTSTDNITYSNNDNTTYPGVIRDDKIWVNDNLPANGNKTSYYHTYGDPVIVKDKGLDNEPVITTYLPQHLIPEEYKHKYGIFVFKEVNIILDHINHYYGIIKNYIQKTFTNKDILLGYKTEMNYLDKLADKFNKGVQLFKDSIVKYVKVFFIPDNIYVNSCVNVENLGVIIGNNFNTIMNEENNKSTHRLIEINDPYNLLNNVWIQEGDKGVRINKLLNKSVNSYIRLYHHTTGKLIEEINLDIEEELIRYLRDKRIGDYVLYNTLEDVYSFINDNTNYKKKANRSKDKLKKMKKDRDKIEKENKSLEGKVRDSRVKEDTVALSKEKWGVEKYGVVIGIAGAVATIVKLLVSIYGKKKATNICMSSEFKNIFNKSKYSVGLTIGAIKEISNTVVNCIKSGFDTVVSTGKKVINTAVSGVKKVYNTAKSIVKKCYNKVKEFVSSAVDTICFWN